MLSDNSLLLFIIIETFSIITKSLLTAVHASDETARGGMENLLLWSDQIEICTDAY